MGHRHGAATVDVRHVGLKIASTKRKKITPRRSPGAAAAEATQVASARVADAALRDTTPAPRVPSFLFFCFLATSACGQRGSPLLGAARCRQGRTPNGSQQQYAWRWPRPATPDACCHCLPSPAVAPQARCCMPLAARRAASATMVVCLYSSSMCCVSALSPATISCCNHAGACLRPPERPALIAGEVGMVGVKLQSQGKTTRHGTSHPSRHSAPIFQLLTPPDLHAPTLTPLTPS